MAISRVTATGIPEQAVESDLLRLNPEIVSGTLPNGMQYYILDHPYPENQVSLRLVVDAGSIQEEADQRGLAHFVEHMAFNGTRDYGETELVAYLEGLGISFGPEVNAFTSFDETVYHLEVPSDDPESYRTGFHVLSQWAGYLTIAPDAVDRERGVIVEEWRGGRSASRRMMEEHIPVIFAGSRYAERLPIGDMDIVRNAPPTRLQDYYRRWSRPDNMAFIAVGDLDIQQTLQLITTWMGSLPRPQEPLHREYEYVPDLPGIRVSVASDPEAGRSSVSVYAPGIPDTFQTVTDYRALLTRALYASIVNERLRDVSRDPQSPFFSAGVGWTRLVRTAELTVATAVTREAMAEEGFSRMIEEIERARRYGVTVGELERAKERFFAGIEESYINRASAPASALADELVRHVVEGEAVPGIDAEYEIYQTVLPLITRDDVNRVAAAFLQEDNRIIVASLREEDAHSQLASRLQNHLEHASRIAVTEPEAQSRSDAILTAEPAAGTISERTEIESVGVTRYALSNGATVYVKRTDFREDEIILSGYSPGGLSLVPDTAAAAARVATAVRQESGLGSADSGELEKILAGSSASISTAIYDTGEAISGTSRRIDMEDLFQLAYAAIWEPRFDEEALERVRRQGILQTESEARDPRGRYYRRLRTILAGGDPRATPLSADEYRALDLQQIAGLYRDRFARPGDWTYVIVGSVDEESLLPLVERYLAAVPPGYDTREPTSGVEVAFDNGYRPPGGIVRETVRAGSEPSGQVTMLFTGDYQWSRQENHRFNSLTDILDTRLREEIREESSGSYGIGAGGYRWRFPEPGFLLQIAFDCDPSRAQELTDRAFAIIEDLRSHAPEATYLERVKAQQRQQFDQNLRENAYWASALDFSIRHGRDLSDILRYPELIDALTPEDIRTVAQRYLSDDSYIIVTLVPESP